ncbi:MAG: UDP-N-acetylmuramate dehydrogenase [Candidatus Eisenbacteria bacterium]|uniref:UDP-N-acetylenolpyruvoylglucosamine reductase n=1 Tax=Eiseniibacteriota bacterium TaxID=2212470 RepID=A0A933W9B7_UNCEI|nr:UDP-N-acetylmuramate dehydrogenase [Candidatus Eisenbacteria bacterium]
MSTPDRAAEALLRRELGDDLLTGEPLRHHTTFRIGGPADFFVTARTTDVLVQALRLAHQLGMPVFLLGGGSNLLVSDDGLRGMVIRNACERVEFDGTAAFVEGGADYLEFIAKCRDQALAGLAYAAGIPGSVGGALYGNAGCYGQDIGARVIECTVATLDGAKVETHPASWFAFEYRDTRLKREPHVILSCLLQLEAGERAAIQREMDEKLEIRRVKHPQWRTEPTAGSYFKNLPPGFQVPGLPHSPGTHRIPAGALLDACDARGLRVGDAAVFAKHANILVNAGHATARDMLALAETLKARVRAKFGVELEEEVMFLGPRPALPDAAGSPA